MLILRTFPVIVRKTFTELRFLITSRFIATLMTLVLCWTGTLLHDFMEQVVVTPISTLQQAVVERNTSISQSAPEFQTVDTEQHFHDVVISLKNNAYVSWFPPAACSLPIICWHWQDHKFPVHARYQRPPPLCGTGLPTLTFMAKRALLV